MYRLHNITAKRYPAIFIKHICGQLCQQQGITVLAILHDLNLTLRYCQQACLLDSGIILSYGEPSTILSPQKVEQLWGYRPEALKTARGELLLF